MHEYFIEFAASAFAIQSELVLRTQNILIW